MKVLMLGWELPPHHTGGLGVVSYDICKYLAAKGVDIDFVLPYSADYSEIKFMRVLPATELSVEEVTRAGGIYDSDKFELHFSDGSCEVTDLERLQERYLKFVSLIVKYTNFDVIHMHDWLTFRAGVIAKMVTGKPLIAHVHATEYDRSAGGSGNPNVRAIEYYGLMAADKILAVSQNTKNILVREYSIDPDRIQVVHNSVNIDMKELSLDPNSFTYLERMKKHGYKVVVCTGRLTIQKGLTQLLDAAKILLEKDPKVIFLFVGKGEQYEELIGLSAELRISDRVIFTGFLPTKEWKDAYKVADLFVMPSVSEPFGITPLEAISFGTPVLISKQSGVSEVLQNALKVDFWDVDRMADLMYSVLNNPSFKKKLLENSRHEVANMSWNKPTDKMIDTYNQILGGSN